MKIDNSRTVKVDELAQLIPTKAGATFSQLWQIFYYTRMFKYISYRHFIQLKASYNKICTYDKLHKLCELGYLRSPQRAVYCATNKVLPILKEAGYNTDLLPQESIGYGNINELNNTDVFVKISKLQYFKTLLYPHFEKIIPDALLIQLDSENRKYKLTFIEIEAKKPKWNEYLESKRKNYLSLSKSLEVYDYWKKVVPKLNLPVPELSNFKFNVSFYCSVKKDFGPAFNFIN